jgi:hypothetical protein
MEEAVFYSERVQRKHPTLLVLLLIDVGVFVPRGN